MSQIDFETFVDKKLDAILGISRDSGSDVDDSGVRYLALDAITIVDDKSTQPRAEMDVVTIRDYSEAYERGDTLPPLKAKHDGETYWLYDGSHRLSGARDFCERVSRGEVTDSDAIARAEIIQAKGLLCEVNPGTLADAQWECLTQNVSHGLRRARADIPRIVALTLAHPYSKDKSYRELAAQIKIDPKTFEKHWRSLSEQGLVAPPPSTITVNRGGQTYQMERGAIGQKEEKSKFLHDSTSDRAETLIETDISSETSQGLTQSGLVICEPSITPEEFNREMQRSSEARSSEFLHDSISDRAETLVIPAQRLETPSSSTSEVPAQTSIALCPADYVDPTTLKPSNEKYTPRLWRDFAETVFGRSIELDPASSALANEVIRAERIYTIEQNGLIQSWKCSTLWLNPPYSMPEIQEFSDKLLSEIDEIDQAIVLVNACTETNWFQALAKSCDRILFPNTRINFYSPGDDPDNFAGRNEYRQALLYWGDGVHAFTRGGASLGLITAPIIT